MPEHKRLLSTEWDECVNYYHFGNALADLAGVARQFTGRQSVGQRAIQAYLDRQQLPPAGLNALLDVLNFMTGPRRCRLWMPKLDRAVEEGQHWRERFHSLACRGFSFRLCASPVFQGCCLSQMNTVNVALLTGPDLYYPPRVRQALQHVPRKIQHVIGAIGWMLCQEHEVEHDRWWYITNIQSDLASYSVSCLREMFRGWQRILFWLLLDLAHRRGVARIAIPPAAALAASSKVGAAGGKRRDAWEHLYDGLASFFDMQRCHSAHPINIQPMRFLPDTWCSAFYAGEVEQMWTRHARVSAGAEPVSLTLR